MRKVMLSLVVLSLFVAGEAFAGEVFKRQCPFSCQSLGIDKAHCKDRKEDDKCVIEVMPGASGNGKVSLTKKCPLSCNSLGIPKERCKDSKEKKKCTVTF